jgi:tRNA(fMet)-specific endonuclease VapC
VHLLDTNILIDFALGRSEPLRRRLLAALPGGLAMSAITYAELAVGSQKSHQPDEDRRRLDRLTQIVLVLPFDEKAAEAYGRLARLVGIGRGSFDRLIAAQALAAALPLVTSNVADFAEVPGLVVENWTEA